MTDDTPEPERPIVRLPKSVHDYIEWISKRLKTLPFGMCYDEDMDQLEIWFEQAEEVCQWQPNGLEIHRRFPMFDKDLEDNPHWLQWYKENRPNASEEDLKKMMEDHKNRITRFDVHNISKFCDPELLQAFKDFAERQRLRREAEINSYDGEGEE